MNANVIGNWGLISASGVPNFQHTGMWYEYFTGDSLDVQDPYMSISLAAGEYRIYTDIPLVKPSITLAVEPNLNASDMKVYPNPSNGRLYVWSAQEGSGAVLDLQGRTILDFKVEAGVEKALDVHDFAAGVYCIQMEGHPAQRIQILP